MAFMEETFDSRFGNPEYRLHREAVRNVLTALLPNAGTEIKGQMKSRAELLLASGYRKDSESFDDLIRILDSELRLITPTDAYDESDNAEAKDSISADRCYQLTHDYLVPVLRDWLNLKKKETLRGRAEIRLEEQAKDWHLRPKNRHLPSALEYLTILLLTKRSRWTIPQVQVMKQATKVHRIRWTAGALVLLLVSLLMMQAISSMRLRGLDERTTMAVASLANVRGEAVPGAIRDLRGLSAERVIPKLQARLRTSSAREKLTLSCALAEYGLTDVPYFVEQVLQAQTAECANLVRALDNAKEASINALRKEFASIQSSTRENQLHKARLAIFALHLGDDSLAAEICQSSSDPIQRTIFVDEFVQQPGDFLSLARVATAVQDPQLQSAICLAVGRISPSRLSTEVIQAWQPLVSTWYQRSKNNGTHSAANWMLRKWNLPLPYIPPSRAPSDGFQWHHNATGLTMLRIDHGEFENRRGAFNEYLRSPQSVALTRDFLISDREISVAEYLKAIEDGTFADAEKPSLNPWRDKSRPRPKNLAFWDGPDPSASPTQEHPATQVSWIEAVMYCNWLSRKEGFTPSYERTGEVWEIPTGTFEEWVLIPNSDGYRLPTHAEWEYACRATTTTIYSFGDDPQFLSQYCVIRSPSTDVCGSKYPNEWGLFDAIGNVSEITNDWSNGYRQDIASRLVDPTGPSNHELLHKTICGGDFSMAPPSIGSGIRDQTVNASRTHRTGFRIARTLSTEATAIDTN